MKIKISIGDFTVHIKDFIFFTLFFLFWVLPNIYVGLTAKDVPFLPPTLSYFYRNSLLFVGEVRYWRSHYLLGLTEESPHWNVLNLKDYFRLTPFGYRTRLDQYLVPTAPYYIRLMKKEGKIKEEALTEISGWVRERHAKLNPDKPPLRGVSIAVLHYPVVRDRVFVGRWKAPTLPFYTPENVEIMSTHYFPAER